MRRQVKAGILLGIDLIITRGDISRKYIQAEFVRKGTSCRFLIGGFDSLLPDGSRYYFDSSDKG